MRLYLLCGCRSKWNHSLLQWLLLLLLQHQHILARQCLLWLQLLLNRQRRLCKCRGRGSNRGRSGLLPKETPEEALLLLLRSRRLWSDLLLLLRLLQLLQLLRLLKHTCLAVRCNAG